MQCIKGRFSDQICVNISYPAFFFNNLYLLDTYSLVGKEIQYFVLNNHEEIRKYLGMFALLESRNEAVYVSFSKF